MYRVSLAALAATAALLLTVPADARAESIDQLINENVGAITGPFVSFIFSPLPWSEAIFGYAFPWIVLWLVVAAAIFTIYFGLIQFRAFGHALALVSGKYADPRDAGEVSQFQALATSLAATVGLGNIAGVAVAVGIGGPGATFWMILAGLLGMATKFAECTLGLMYRNENPDGTVSGGPMYYLSKGFAKRGKGGVGKVLAFIFSIFCVLGSFGGGNMFQANQTHSQITVIVGDYPGWITGLVFAVIVFAVIVGGLKSIARVTEKVAPLMAILYVGAALTILIINADKIGWAFGQIFAGAFTEVGVAGGVIGALILGFQRAAFSNEAGVGSAAIAQAAVKTKEPITGGFVSMLGPFVDTVVICTMTALVIIISGVLETDPVTGLYVWDSETGHIATAGQATGVQLTSAAFSSAFTWLPYVLALVVVLFAFSTVISWSYYGLKAWTYLFGEGKAQELSFKIIFCLFVVIGAAMSLGPVIDFSDAAIFAMALINIVGLYLLMPAVKAQMQSYLSRLRTGEIQRFKA